ncbi:hypothetical protein LOD99_3255 [Oopsacas minuta]|uniref:VPS9 domain-containing protein n=1 Tax=Oopsacas minuta TaxID=111878 RepID=A0AAV7JXU6_9METZ|nr:hypothetical protein LOD99_3255 [Oopsacas minuta]
MATVLQNLSRVNLRLLSQDLKLVFKFTNLDIYASYIDSLVLNQKSQNEVIEGEISPKKFTKNACFFYKKLEAERTHILISKQDLIFLQKSIRNISSIETLQEHNPILKQLEETKSVVMSLERAEPILQSKKKKTPTDTPNTPPKISLPRLMLFPIKERDPDQPEGFEIKSEEEIIHGKKQVTSLRDISKENTAIHSALKDSYCMDGNFLLTRSAKTRQNSVSGYETLRRGVNPMSSICDETSESSSSSEDEEDKSYEGDTSGLGSLANSNSSTYKVDTGTLKPPLPPYPSSKASVSSNTPSISVQLQDQSDSDPLEHSDEHPEVLHSKDSLIRLQRSASLGDKDCFEHLDIYQNAEELRKVSAKKSNTLVSSPKKTASISDSFPISKHFAAHDKPKVMLRSKRFKKNARNIIKTVSTFGHHQKLSKRLDSLSLTKSSSNSDLKEMSTPARETQWTKLRTSTFTYMTMKSRQKAIPTSKYFTLLPLDSPTCYFQSNMNSLIKRLRLVLSTCSYPDLNIPEPDFLPIEIQQQASELGDQDNDSSQKISMSPDIANKRSLVSMLNHEFNIAISRNDIPQIALTSDLLHTIDIMSESQVAAAIDGLNKEYLARREYMQYLTTTSLKLSSQQERIITYEKFLLCQVEELEKLFMDTEARSFLLQNNTLLQLDFNLSVSDDKPLTIQNSVYFTLEQMRVDPIWHNWMYYDALLCSIERNIYNHIYYGLFFPDGITDQDDNELFRIRLNLLSKKLQIDDPFLAIHPKYYFSSPWPGALQLLHTINIYKSPRDKLDVITNCCKLITNLLHFTDPTEALGADEILPVLIFVTVNSNPKYLYANCAFLERYSDSIEKGETAYWFNQFYIAIANLKTLFKSHGIVA